jgi:hypothetical protein
MEVLRNKFEVKYDHGGLATQAAPPSGGILAKIGGSK